MTKKVISVNRSVLYALDTVTVRLKETEKQLYEANKNIEQLVKEKDMLYAQHRKYKEAFLRQGYQVGDYASLEQALMSEAAENFNTLMDDTVSEILYNKGAFKHLGNSTESKTFISKEEFIESCGKTIKDTMRRLHKVPLEKELYDLMAKAYELCTKNPLGPAEYFEYDTGVRVGKVESEADTDNKKDS